MVAFGDIRPSWQDLFEPMTNVIKMKWVPKDEYLTMGNHRLSPQQKPLLFYKSLLASFPTVGMVLDIFANVGSASFAAYLCGVDFIAIEHDFDCCKGIQDRFYDDNHLVEVVKGANLSLRQVISLTEEEVWVSFIFELIMPIEW